MDLDTAANKLLIQLENFKNKIRSRKNSDVEDHLSSSVRPLLRPKSWWMISVFAVFNTSAIYGLYLFIYEISWAHLIYEVIIYEISMLGGTMSVHRYYSHKAFKVTKPLQLVLMILQTMTNMDTIYRWVRDHRMHHKYTDTHADPMNINNGIIFASVGWLMVKKHPMVKWKGRTLDISDIEEDPIVMFQKKYYHELWFIFNVIVPSLFPVFVLGESFANVFFVTSFLRLVILNGTLFLLNGVGHRFGTKPYDSRFSPTNSVLIHILTRGDGEHNFHHAFPTDYRSSESGFFNLPAAIIELFAYFGWAYDLKTASPETAAARARRTGDGSQRTLRTGLQGTTRKY